MTSGYYDLHNHTLPGVDDGAREMEDALKMARIAAEGGTKLVLLTPHSANVAGLVADGRLAAYLDPLRQAVASAGIALEFALAMENHLTSDLPALAQQGVALPINGTRYILVELPYTGPLPLYADATLFALQLQGLTPVIAHPERCEALMQHPELLDGYARRGMLAQVTAASLLNAFGRDHRKAGDLFLRRGLAQVIASDAHNWRGPRTPALAEGVAAAARFLGEHRAEEMAGAVPAALLRGELISPDPAPLKPGKFRP